MMAAPPSSSAAEPGCSTKPLAAATDAAVGVAAAVVAGSKGFAGADTAVGSAAVVVAIEVAKQAAGSAAEGFAVDGWAAMFFFGVAVVGYAACSELGLGHGIEAGPP
jgi:hypothetical protein